MTERRLHVYGIGLAVLVHAGVVGGVWAGNAIDRQHTEKKAKLGEKKYETIEAGLVARSQMPQGKKSRLATKEVDRKAKPPPASGVGRDPDAVADPSKRPKEQVPLDMQDPNSVFDKYRNRDTPGGEAQGAAGDGAEVKAGSADGSEWGTLEEAKGDPYVGELVGRMTTNPEMQVPSVVADSGLVTLGCVRLDEQGRIVEREVPKEGKSRNATFNRAVEERLRITTDMDRAVPATLHDLLVKRGICIEYKL